MRQDHCSVTSADVRREAENLLLLAVPLKDYKRSLTAAQLCHVLLAMACWGVALFTVCRRLLGLPSHETVRKALYACLPDYDFLLRGIVTALQSNLPKSFRKRRWDLAIDLHGIPFYGDKDTPGVRGGQHKQGTKYFWTYATIALLHKGRRWTLGVLPVHAQALEVIVAELLKQLEPIGLLPRSLLLDRGFYSAEVVIWLQDKGIAFVMPALNRGKLDSAKGPTGTSGYFAKTQDGIFEYSWKKRGKKNGKEVKVMLAVVVHSRRLRHTEKKKGKKAGKGGWLKSAWVFAYSGVTVVKARSVMRRYKKRFGIESSYRQLRQGLAASGSKDQRLRLLLVGLALLLRNAWVWLHWQILSTARRGFRKLNLALLPLQDLLLWVVEEVKNLYGLRLAVPSERKCL
jgi:Transposase DDE domain